MVPDMYTKRAVSLTNIKVSRILYFIYLILLIKPYSIQVYPTIELTWDILCITISLCYGMILLIKRGVDTPLVLLSVFCLLYCALTFYSYPENILGAISESVRIIMMFGCVSRLCSTSFEDGLKTLSASFSLLLYLDAASILYNVATSGQVSAYSLLGYDNNAIFYIIPMLATVFYYSYYRYDLYGINSITLLVLTAACKLLTGAATSIIAMLFLAVALIVVRYSDSIPKLLNIKNALLVIVSSTVGLVVLHIERYFAWLFDLLGKDITLSYRTTIWTHSISAIVKRPFGYGKTGDGIFQVITGFSPLYDLGANHTHNYVLELLFVSGVPGTIIYLFFIVSVSKLCRYSKQVSILLAGIIAYAILMITDSYIFVPTFYALLAVLSKTQLAVKHNE